MIRWPLHGWIKGIGTTSSTRRETVLSGGTGGPNWTDLGTLRRFMSTVEKWPDSASVTKHDGAVIGIEFYENADPMTVEATNG